MRMDVACLREHQKSLQFSVKKLLEHKIEGNNAGAYFDVQDKRILSKRGGVTIFDGMQSHTADSIKSLEAFDRAWFEEAHRASQRSLNILRPTFFRKPGSELWFSWNPELPTDPIEKLLRGNGETPPEVPEGDAIVVAANYRDNPFFPKDLLREVELDQRRDPDKFAHVWLGGYLQNSEARVFRNWKVEEFETPAGAHFRLGADWGFAVDPSVLVRCYLDGRRLYVDYEAYMVGCEIDQLPDLFRTVPDSERWFMTADSARPETISYMKRHGFPKITAAIKGARSLEEGVEFLKSFDIVVHPRCEHVIQELSTYCYEVDELTGQVMPKLKDKDNHTIDALRYACEGVRRARVHTVNRPREAQAEYAMFGER
jgi:phage terminase large subunit